MRAGGFGIFEAIILDVDGTLVDSNDAHAHAFAEAFRERGYDVPFARIRRLIGKGSDKLVPELIGRCDEAVVARKKEIFMARYLPRLRAFPRVPELLQKFRESGRRMVVASSAGKDELEALLEVAGARPFLEAAADADDAERSKPDPDILQAALRRLRLPPQRCVMLGDTPYDAQAAARAGVAFIGLRCGGWGAQDLQPALAVHRDPADLLAACRSLEPHGIARP